MTGFPKTLSDFKQSQTQLRPFGHKGEWGELFEDQAQIYLKQLDFFSKKTEDWRWFPFQKIMDRGFVFCPPVLKKKELKAPPGASLASTRGTFSDNNQKGVAAATAEVLPKDDSPQAGAAQISHLKGLFPSSLVLSFQNGQLLAPALNQKECLVFSWTDFLNGKVGNELSAGLKTKIRQKIINSLKEQRNPLCSLNNALCCGGYIVVLRAAFHRTLEIHFSHDLMEDKQGLNLRNFIFAEDYSSAQMVELFQSSSYSDRDYLDSGFAKDHSESAHPTKDHSDRDDSVKAYSEEDESKNSKNNDSKKDNLKNRGQEKSLFLNVQTDVFIGKSARLEHIRLDQLQESDSLIHQLFSSLSEKASVQFLSLSLSAGLSRCSTQIQQEAKSSSEIRGLSLLMGKRQADHKVYVSHKGPGGKSQQSYLAFLSDSAKHIFKGCISIEQKAQETIAEQLCKSFLLSEKAFSVSSPELDIIADNVKASHGATVSSFEENRLALFYLQSRGIEPQKALQMLIAGLVRESIASLPSERQKALQVFLKDHLKHLTVKRIL